ncbi:MAG: hypothetical protein HUJ93_07585, partial [Bacteroidales bacterium]|nr:hypothetical protein [Bacteroidales bacterium]
MNENTATRENCREVMAWLRGSQAAPDPAMEDRFLDVLTAMVRQRIEEDNRERERLKVAQERRERRARLAANPSLSIRRIVEEMQKAGETDLTYEELMGTARKDEPKNEVPSDERVGDKPSELDSLTIGRVIRYMGTAEGHPLNMSQIQIILYISYGVCLAGTGERLTSEHPQVWQFGPVFPRAYNKLRKDP